MHLRLIENINKSHWITKKNIYFISFSQFLYKFHLAPIYSSFPSSNSAPQQSSYQIQAEVSASSRAASCTSAKVESSATNWTHSTAATLTRWQVIAYKTCKNKACGQNVDRLRELLDYVSPHDAHGPEKGYDKTGQLLSTGLALKILKNTFL